MNEYESIKKKIINTIETKKEEILKICNQIHSYAEYGTMEFKSSNLLTSKLNENGFKIEAPKFDHEMEIYKEGLKTAIKASYQGKDNGPVIGINAEYDALPGIGHGCGHNIIAASAYGAVIGLKTVMPDLNGTLRFLGSPAEERFMDNSGGKVIMLNEYRKLDACMYVHPSSKWSINVNPIFDNYAAFADQWKITFKGTLGHLAQSMEVANAQRAAIITMNALDSLHIVPPIEHVLTGRGLVDFKDGEPFYFTKHGLLDIAEMGLYIRQNSKENLIKAVKRMKDCASGVASATNTQVSFKKFAPTYESQITNVPLAKTFKQCFEELGVPILESTPSISPGTSDFGNVSRVTPSTSASIKIGENLRGHTPEFAEAAASEEGNKAAIIGAKAMALLSAKLFIDTDLIQNAKTYFNSQVH